MEFSLDLLINLKVTDSHCLWDLLTDFFTAFSLKIHVELSEIFLKISLRWLANSFGLFNEVIFNFCFTVNISFIGFIIHNHLSFLLIEKSFSHVFVLLKSNGLGNVLLDNIYELFVGVRFVLCSWFSFNFLLKLVFLIEQFLDVIFSDLSQIFVNLGFNLRFVTEVVGVWV